MDKKEALVELSGQIINGIMSSDSSTLTKLWDRTTHSNTANVAVNLAIKMLNKIEEYLKETENDKNN